MEFLKLVRCDTCELFTDTFGDECTSVSRRCACILSGERGSCHATLFFNSAVSLSSSCFIFSPKSRKADHSGGVGILRTNIGGHCDCSGRVNMCHPPFDELTL